MKVKTLVLAGISSAVLAVPTNAAEISVVQIMDYTHGDFGATGLQAYEIWLTGLGAGDQLTAIYGDGDNPLTIQTDAAGGFFNAGELGQGSHAGNPALFAAFPELQWDTYVVIGADSGTGDWSTSPGFPDMALAGGGASIIANDNLAWFDGDPGTAVLEDGGAILIGQLVFEGGATASGSVSAQIIDASGTERRENGLEFVIPAPGALALLGVAGLIGRRRRA